jgi:hypothetical protein
MALNQVQSINSVLFREIIFLTARNTTVMDYKITALTPEI